MQAILPGRPPGEALALDTPRAPTGEVSAAAASKGRIVIAGADPRRRGGLLVVQGTAGGRFRPLLEIGSRPAAASMSTAYLGDLALLAPLDSEELGLRIERWSANGLGPQRAIVRPGHVGPPGSLTVAMDYRSDAIAAWAQDGSIWAADVPQHAAARPAVRLGPAGSAPHIAALLSDDNRAIVMWTDRSQGRTRVWLDYSASGPRFDRPRLLERFSDPPGPTEPPGSPQLVRLSSEGVMTAWAGVVEGRWVVRTAPIDQHGLGKVGTIAAAGADLLLYALAPGPEGDAVALLGEPRAQFAAGIPAPPGQSGRSTADAVMLLAARGTEPAGRTSFSALETVGEAPEQSGATVAVEPGSDRAVAAWKGAGGRIFYSLRNTP